MVHSSVYGPAHRFVVRTVWTALVPLAAAPVAPAQVVNCTSCGTNQVCLENASSRYTFTYDSTSKEAWLSEAEVFSPAGTVMTLGRTPMWDLELRVDPLDDDEAHSRARIDADDPSASLTVTCFPNFDAPPADGIPDPLIRFSWTVTLQGDPDLPGGPPDPQAQVHCWWGLGGSQDFLQTFVDVRVLNPTSQYRLWNIRFPRLDICNPSGSGGDVLATSRYGGMLFTDPIHYEDAVAGGFLFQPTTEMSTGIGHLNARDPSSTYTVPLTLYSDSSSGSGLYLANNDDSGYFKTLHLIPRPSGSECGEGALTYEVMQYPSDPTHAQDVFEATRYVSPYKVFVGAMNGDWVDAARKYRHYRKHNTDNRFLWLKQPGAWPSGHPSNDYLPDGVKTNPYMAKIASGTGYDISSMELDASGQDLAVRQELADLESLFGTFPILIFTRFLVAFDEIVYNDQLDKMEFVPGGCDPPGPATLSRMGLAYQLVADAVVAGHGVVLDSMTEKFAHSWIPKPLESACSGNIHESDCLPSPSTYNWPRDIDAVFRQIAYDSTLFGLPTHVTQPIGPNPCTQADPVELGQAPCGGVEPDQPTTWFTAFTDFVGDAVAELGISGLRFNAPGLISNPCFARDDLQGAAHQHPPGFGNHSLQGWFDVIREIRTKAGVSAAELTVMPEEGNSTIAQEVRISNPVSVALSADFGHHVSYLTQHSPSWNNWFDAPIAKIPMLQMVADEMRYMNVGNLNSLALPYTSLQPGEGADIDNDGVLEYRDFFADFPSAIAALQCWEMAERVLIHQSSVAVQSLYMVDGDLLQDATPVTTNEYAARGLAEFYIGLAEFLTAAPAGGLVNMGYFTGTMERSPRIEITNAPMPEEDQFAIPGATVSAHFRDLHDFWSAPYPAGGDALGRNTRLQLSDELRFDRYRPLDTVIFGTNFHAYTPFAVTVAPEEHPCWLPHGMYRHWSDSEVGPDHLALLVANPWGVKHISPGFPATTKPMNPFTFDYASPATSPATKYTYAFDFDPLDYDWGSGDAYTVRRVTYDLDGSVLQDLVVAGSPFTGAQSFDTAAAGVFDAGYGTGLKPFHFDAFYIDKQ